MAFFLILTFRRWKKEPQRSRPYGRQWVMESVFSAFKRIIGSTLRARQPDTQRAEAANRVLAQVLRR